jgi:DNA polymerase I-like protein with 3'-5' exonuclease and polymerase domains
MQLPLFVPESNWSPPSLSELPSWAGARRVAIDTETRDENLKKLGPGVRRGGYIVGYSFAIEDGPKHYVPMRHMGGDNVDPVQALAYLRYQAANFEGEIVGANLPYDLDYLAETDVHFTRTRRFLDVQIADPLINELQRSYSLAEIAKRHGIPGKDEELLREAARAYGVDPKGDMWKLPGRFVGKYGEADADRPLRIMRKQEKIIEDQDLWQVFHLESDILPVLLKMRRRGVKVDFERLEKVEAWSLAEEGKELAKVQHLTGLRIAVGDVWKAAALAPVFHHLGIALPKTAAGKDSIRKDILDTIDHPVAHAIKRARKVNKIRTTFAQSVRTYETQGRIHATFNQLRRTDESDDSEGGAAYGRLSCVDPNMQQQPARDGETGPMWRSIYRPDFGQWCSADLSQQEPRWLIHWACITGSKLLGEHAWEVACKMRDSFRENPKTDSYDAFSAYTGLKRKEAKEVYLGRIYAMGGAKMARKLGLPTKWIENRAGKKIEVAGDEAQAIIDRFDGGVPYGRKMAELCERQAKKNGFIKTMSGRRCRFPVDDQGNFDWTHKSLNRLIQGSSADQVKLIMLALDKENIPIQLQVHDELCTSVNGPEEATRIQKIMMEAVPLQVPMKVDVELGDSWGASMGFEWNL